MRRSKIVRSTIEELKKRIRVAEKAKKEYIDYLCNLHDKYEKGCVSYSDYLEAIYEKKDGKNIHEWISYLDDYIEYCKKSLREPRADLIKHKLTIILFSFILIFLAFISTVYLRPEFVGFLVQEPIPDVVSEANVTITTTQSQAILEQPVKWTKTISLDNIKNVTIRLPIEARNITVKKITESYSEKQEKALQNRTRPSHEEPFSSETKFRITGVVISETNSGFFRNIVRLTGRIIGQEQETIEIEIEDNVTEYEIEYETPAPYTIEEPIEKRRGKRIKIIGPKNIHYENVLAFTTLDEALNIRNPSQVKIHWIENNSFVSIKSLQDTNNNGIYDYIEWLAPSLSEATFDIIVIIKAEHLDSNKEFISDIYEEVRELDDVWSETIENQDYVRVTFEAPLDSSKDITIYPRVVSGNPRIKVYEFEGTEVIATFNSLNSNEYNKVFLTSLQGSQDVFDLRVLGGSVEFDHIIDPTLSDDMNVTQCTVADSKDATCFAVENFNDGNLTTSGATVEKGGIIFLVMDNVTGLNEYATIDLVNLSLYHDSNAGVSNAWTILLQEEDGSPTYCSDNTIVHVETPQWDYWDLTSCTTWTKAKLDDLRVEMRSGDAAGSTDSFVFELDINVSFTPSPPSFDNPQINETGDIFPGMVINHSINISKYPTQYLFSWNASGASCDTWVNSSWTTVSGNFTTASNSSEIPSACADKTIGWRFYGNNSGGINSSSIQEYNVSSYGVLNVDISLPTDNTNVDQNETFTITANITCSGGAGAKCGTITGLARYNGSGATPNTDINITEGATPFYISSRDTWNKSLDETVFNSASTIDPSITRIDDDSVAIAYAGSAVGSNGTYVVYNINGTVELDETVFNPASTSYTSITRIDDDSVAIAYRDDGAFGDGKYVVYNINGTVELDETVFDTVLTSYTSITRIDNDSVAIAYVDGGAGSNGTYVVYNINGTVELDGTVFNSASTSHTSITRIDDDSVAIAYVDVGAGDNGTYVVYNINGSVELDETVFNPAATTYTSITRIDNNTVAISYADVGDVTKGKYVVYNINGSVELDETLFNDGASTHTSITGIDDDTVVISYADSSAGDGKYVVYNINGSVELDETVFNPAATSQTSITRIDNNTVAISYVDTSAGSNGTYVVYSLEAANPKTSSETLESGENFTISWTVNATGTPPSSYEVDVLFNSTTYYPSITANDTEDRTVTITAATDTEQPKWQENTTNSTVAGTFIKHSVRWTDNSGLDGFIFSFDNGTGTFLNDTFVSMTTADNYSNVTKFVNETVGATVRWIVYANDSSSNWNNTDTFIYNTTSANAAPTIDIVEVISAQSPIEAGNRTITFNFTATDTDGGNNINVSTAEARFQRSGEPTRLNLSCNSGDVDGNNLNFTCVIDMTYFDENGAWTINVTVRDNSQATGENSSTTFTYNLLTAMVMSPTALGWPTVNLPDVDTGSTSDPITINNTGNAVNLNINITALDLQGELTTSEHIFAENFTVENISEGCGVGATAMINATQVNVTSLILQRGNNDLGNGQEEVFFCLKGVPQDITAQPYSSSALGSWTIRILLVAVIPARRKKKKKNIRVGELSIPATIFSKELGVLETITKYMKENLEMSYSEIAEELNRDQRTIWTAYKKAIEKQRESLEIRETDIFLSTSILRNRKLTILESIILYLKEKGLKYSEIAGLLDRDQRNIWAVYSRAIGKISEKEIEDIKEINIPITIFSKELGVLETITKYMKENLKMNYNEIAELLNRNEITIRTSYKKAVEKQKKPIEIRETEIFLPISIFKNRNLTILESIIIYLKQARMKYSEIAELLDRDQRNIWTIYSRTVRKKKRNV